MTLANDFILSRRYPFTEENLALIGTQPFVGLCSKTPLSYLRDWLLFNSIKTSLSLGASQPYTQDAEGISLSPARYQTIQTQTYPPYPRIGVCCTTQNGKLAHNNRQRTRTDICMYTVRHTAKWHSDMTQRNYPQKWHVEMSNKVADRAREVCYSENLRLRRKKGKKLTSPPSM